MPSLPRKVLILLPLVFLGLARPVAAVAQPAATAPEPEPRAAEYMIYQYAGVALVVIVDAFETEFTARVVDPEGALLTVAGVDGRRIGPLYLYVDSSDRPRQLMVHVQPERPVARDAIGMELMQLSQSDPNARRQGQAYRLLALGMQASYSDDTSSRVQRGRFLHDAGRAFAALGMERMRLWSEYYAAHLLLHGLDDESTALARAAEIRAAADRAGFATVGLAARTLEADALLRGAGKARGERAQAYAGQTHTALAELASAAAALGYPGEQGRALFLDGMAWEREGRPDRAIERYDQALAVTRGTPHVDLLNRIRATAAAAYERQGRTAGAIGLLDDIAGDLPVTPSADAERAEALYQKGRLLSQAYRYREAAGVLAEALRLQQESPAVSQWGQTGLALGEALYALGDLPEARAAVLDSLPRAAGVDPAVRARGYGILANLARHQGAFDEMARHRARQAELAGPGVAEPAFEAALDAVAEAGAGSAVAIRGFERARDLAASAGDARGADRAAQYLCASRLASGGACDPGRAEAAYRARVASGIPRIVADAHLVQAGILRQRGDRAAAAREVDALLGELRFYREQLPGVLGAWNWSRATEVYRLHLALALERSRSGAGGSELLLALGQVRELELARGDASGREDLRQKIAALDRARVRDAGAARRVSAALESAVAAYGAAGIRMNRAMLDAMLDRLDRSESLLTWYLSDSRAWLLAAGRRGVRLLDLGRAYDVRRMLDSFGQVLAGGNRDQLDAQLEGLGVALLGPVWGDLGERVYLLTQGDLNAIPFDALRRDGRFLAETRNVARLESLAALERRQPVMREGFEQAVFLAGNPQTGRDPFSYDVDRSAEIDAVRDRFIGAGLHIVQGVALDRGEFSDPRFSDASLLHLAMPGRIDLADPERSRLLVSGPGTSSAAGFLNASDIRNYALDADLVVLTGTAVEGRSRTAFDARLGLVTDFQWAGAAAVVASLWPAGDAVNAPFLADFYARLKERNDIVSAFSDARRSRMDAKNPSDFRRWAGFQLFIR